jgi:hypothetical protein
LRQDIDKLLNILAGIHLSTDYTQAIHGQNRKPDGWCRTGGDCSKVLRSAVW